ncbi:MFS transporter [Mesorhizobium mediterraneum]|uniref:MFS transporter n=1 Tax=Mesorhizobium mediterraneum TaxID=43617 RepID=A0AB36R5K7_9HYPH|nr:MFS transporter [Mesorhizobium mediterraneum]PAP99759.1 MFS transporter [Mesorhizobium mediterraneum]RWN41490.1 MAG: MFS transporter [Mesorhizobium sp.]WIW54770.1 MFS transporter [Mesorhizobium mediterraneum]
MTFQIDRNTVALAGACLASLLFGLEISSVPVILPKLESVLAADFKDLQWIMNAYTIACTTVLMATGTLADRFGRKRVMVITTVAFGFASLLCGLAPSAPLLIVARFLQGLAGGAMFTCSVAVLSHQFQDGSERGKAFVAWSVVSGIGLGFGPAIGGLIVTLSSWQWVFLIHVPLAILALVFIGAGVTESSDRNAQKLDRTGILTLSLAVFGFSYLITQGADLGSGARIGVTSAAVLAFIAFLVAEKINPYPMFDFSVFRIRQFSGAIMGGIGMNFSYWPFIIYLPIYFSGVLGYDSTTTGLLLLVYTLPLMLMSSIAERLRARYQARVAIPLGLLTLGIGFIAMWIGSGLDGANWLTMLPGTLIAGIGIGLTNSPTTNTTTGSVSPDRAGMASGIDISARLITLAINIAVLGLLLTQGIVSYLRDAFGTTFDPNELQTLAEKIAAGNLDGLSQHSPKLATLDPSGTIVHAALVNGFGWVMLYSGIGVLVLAVISFIIFGPKNVALQEARGHHPAHSAGEARS